MAAALKPGPKRSSAPGSTEVQKKVAVSLTRRAAVSLDKVLVIAIGSAEYLFMKVAMKAPRMKKGLRFADMFRSNRAPSSTNSISSHSGVRSLSLMKATNSGEIGK